MIELHYWPTPNGKKVTILLEELGIPYKVVQVNIGRGDQYSIADMICYPWTINWKFQGQDIEEFKHFKRWFDEMGARPAVQKGMAAGADLSVDNTKLPPEEQARIRKMLYNQRARPVPA